MTQKLSALIVSIMLFIVACSAITPKEEVVAEIKPVRVAPVIAPEPAPAYTADDLACLQRNVFFEARNQSIRGMEAVALVTVRRTQVKGYPDTICGVVEQSVTRFGVIVRNRCQFSWYCDGKADEPNLDHPEEARQWNTAGDVARRVLEGQVVDFTNKSTHYHATYCKPKWSEKRRMHYTARVGDHVFYRDVKRTLKA